MNIKCHWKTQSFQINNMKAKGEIVTRTYFEPYRSMQFVRIHFLWEAGEKKRLHQVLNDLIKQGFKIRYFHHHRCPEIIDFPDSDFIPDDFYNFS